MKAEFIVLNSKKYLKFRRDLYRSLLKDNMCCRDDSTCTACWCMQCRCGAGIFTREGETLIYITGSGMGEYTFKKDYVLFEGRRNSICGGTEFFYPKSFRKDFGGGSWEILESWEPARGIFAPQEEEKEEDKRPSSFYCSHSWGQ